MLFDILSVLPVSKNQDTGLHPMNVNPNHDPSAPRWILVARTNFYQTRAVIGGHWFNLIRFDIILSHFDHEQNRIDTDETKFDP